MFCLRGILIVVKKFLRFLFVYFNLTVSTPAVFAIFFAMYQSCLAFVAGTQMPLVSLKHFLNGFFLAVPFCLAFSSLFLIMFQIRHSKKDTKITVAYFCLGLLSWLIFIPGFYKIAEPREFSLKRDSYVQLSSGYFRNVENGTLYFSQVFPYGDYDGLLFDTKNHNIESSNVFVMDKERPEKLKDSDFVDSLIKDSLPRSNLFMMILDFLIDFYSTIKNALEKGYSYYLFVASMGIPLIALLCLKKISGWKLLSVTTIIASYIFVLIMNFFYYNTTFFTWLINLFSFIKNDYLQKSFGQLALNLLFLIIIGFWGIVAVIKDKARGQGIKE